MSDLHLNNYITRGNIFTTKCQTIVNTVNCVGVMGRGIALECKLRYPDMFNDYAHNCTKNRILINKEFNEYYLWKGSEPWILNFPTKNHWKQPSKLKWIEIGLKHFQGFYKKAGITSIAFPLLGSDAGKINQDDVIDLMSEYLCPLMDDIEIEVYTFNPETEDPLFTRLYQKIQYYDVEDYKKNIGTNTPQSELIKQYIDSGNLHSMMSLQMMKGIGEKTLEKIYEFAKKDEEESNQQMTIRGI